VTGTVHQILDATVMAYRATFRELGIILAFVVLFPVGFLFFLGVIVRPDLRAQVLVGSMMMEMALLNVNVLAQTIGNDKHSKLWDLWVSLPARPTVYVVSNALTLLPFSLLASAVTLGLGAVYFGIPLSVTLIALILPAFLIVWASTLGIGFLIGVYGGPPRRINTVAQFVGIVMTFFAPIFYPLSALPTALQYVAAVWPLTWGELLLVDLIHGAASGAAVAAAVLGGFTALWFVLIGVGLRWREP
jgi:ABC-2 type transport system permease protein